jgi:hypothetical protein
MLPVRHCPRPCPPHDAMSWARGITGPEHSAEPGGAPEPCPEHEPVDAPQTDVRIRASDCRL